MKATKEERFRELLEREGLGRPARPGIPRREGPREGEASFAQRRIWLNQMLDPQSTVYNVLLGARLDGRLAPHALTQALQAVVDRHEALRTCFRVRRGQPQQCVQARLPVALNLVDLRPAPAGALEALLAAKQGTRFELQRAPLFDFTLARLGDEAHVLLLALHHIVFDFVSSQVLFEDLDRSYAAYAAGGPCALPELRVQYLDYSDWQRAEFESSDREATLRRWQESLGAGDEIPLLELPGDRAAARDAAFVPACERFVVPAALQARVGRASAETGVSAFCVWLVGFLLLLQRYTDADDLVLCVPHSERDAPELSPLVGFFINPLVVRLRASRAASFRALLRAMHADYLEALSTRRFPFDKLVEALAPRREAGLARLGDLGFGYQRSARAAWSLGGLRLSFVDVNVPIAKSELSLSIYEDPALCRGYLEYNGARFSGALMAGLARQYVALLEALLDAPERPVGALAPGPARAVEAAASEVAADEAAGVHALFARRVGVAPDATALVAPDGQVSFRALDRRARRLARGLRRAGVVPGDAVAVRLARRCEAYACLLAVLRCGATYVPIERAQPAAYARRLAALAGARWLVAEAEDVEALSAAAGAPPALGVDRLLEADAAAAGGDPPAPGVPERIAYVCFTSGTQGESKGVPVAHAALVRHLRAFQQALPTDASDRVLQFAALTFDVALEQVFSAWAVGAALVARGDEAWGAREFVELLEREQVSVANPPTAYWSQVVKLCAASGLALRGSCLRRLIAGGEPMTPEAARAWEAVGGGAALVNAYGPTEAVVTACAQVVSDAADAGDEATVPIGRPLPGRRAYVVDRVGLPVPDGAPGELWLDGPLALGYLGSPRLTAERFRPAPVDDGGAPGRRVYASGDCVRRRPDESLVYLHRRDDEVKLRGVRVAPTVVESALLEHPGVVEAAVVARDAPAEASPRDDDEWRELLARLPPAAVEDALRALEAQADDGRLARHEPEFELLLRLRSPAFVATAREAQRNWLLNRALDEWAADLRALDEIARRLVAGSERVEIARDLAGAPAVNERGLLLMEGQQVMQDWQRPLMRELARAAAERGGDVLEIGFGMGLAAGFIQEQGVRSHVIVEANDQVAEEARRWARRRPDAQIRVLHAKWQEAIDELGGFDGILFDTYPLTETEFRRHVLGDVTFAAHFFPAAARHLRAGGVFTYYTNEIDSLSRRHQRLLLASFDSFRVGLVRGLQPPPDSQNWWADSMAVVRAFRG